VTGGLLAFVLRRVFGALLFVVVISASALALVRLAPGDATSELALSRVDRATVEKARARMGLDRPIGAQIAGWIGGLARFDLGESSLYGRPVAGLVAGSAANTARLAAVALVIAPAIGLPIGLMAGARPRGILARLTAPVSIALVSCPPIVGALVLLLLAVKTGWLSIAPGDLLLPSIALALPVAATLERIQAQATRDTLGAPDLAAGAARGLSPRRLLWTHAARQSLRPVLGTYGIVMASLFSGSLAVEYATSWPGLGRLLYDAVVARDLYLSAGCALCGAALIAAGNLGADLLRAAVDPRVRT
jgi:peptide/nickel transport system permease protein